MEMKTFEAFSMKDAVKSVKKALGSNAVIISTREKPAPGGKGTIYELTATSAETVRSHGASTNLASLGNERALEAGLDGLSVRMTALQDSVPTRRQIEAIEAGLHELKLLLLENLRTKDGSSLKDLSPPLAALDRQLRLMTIDDTSIADLMKHLRNLKTPEQQEPIEEYYRDHAIRWMMKRITIAPRWLVGGGATTIQAIVGPTGVGKTSLVAKLAAHYHLREKMQVRVVSFDNQRLAAADQLRVSCKIIGVPFHTISQAQDLPELMNEHPECDLMVIDTAGRSPKGLNVLNDLNAFRSLGIPIDFHLCLSITEKEPQLEQAIRAFSSLGISSLIFSKLDESWSFGEIFNLSKKWSLPLSFFAIGQRIPDDIERASRERVVERIFGL